MTPVMQQCFVSSEVLGFLGVISCGGEAETGKKYYPICFTEVLKVTTVIRVVPWALAIRKKLMGE